MEPEFMFRIAFVLLWILFIVARVIPSRNVPTVKRSRNERLDALKKEGRIALVSMILATYGNLIVGALYLVNPPWMWWSYFVLPMELRFVGLVIAVVSLPFAYWIGKTLADSFSFTLEIQEDQKLVTTGPYSRIRHPLYTATLLFLIGQILVSDNWLFLAIVVVLVPYLFKRMRKEEDMMVEEFGEDYIEYMKKTGRLLPRIRTSHEEISS